MQLDLLLAKTTKVIRATNVVTIKRSSTPARFLLWGRPEQAHMQTFDEHFEVVVVGAGHAGCEAAMAAARMGVKTALYTLNVDLIAQMSCNPAIGGIAKGHLVREVDALGGIMGEITDAVGIQFRLLNTSRGPAVWSPRAQCDKQAYRLKMREVLESQANLKIKQAEVSDVIVGSTQHSAFSGQQKQVLRSAQDDNVWEGSDANDEQSAANSGSSKLVARGSQPAAIYSKFRNRVMFPICNEQGKVIAFTGRTLSASTDEKAGPKYLNSPETAIYSKSRVLFNLDNAKEAIRKLEYSILVEGQMDCISVYAAGFHNVIASSGTAFTELQAKLLGRFSKKVVVNFDPDTAGARATERTLGLLVEEEFNIQVLTLETGFDPDLFIRRKGKDAYAAALKHSQKYFDYLIDRARAMFPARNSESKVKAVNHLLPHIQRVPSRIVRDGLALEISQKLGIDSAVLRQRWRRLQGRNAF